MYRQSTFKPGCDFLIFANSIRHAARILRTLLQFVRPGREAYEAETRGPRPRNVQPTTFFVPIRHHRKLGSMPDLRRAFELPKDPAAGIPKGNPYGRRSSC